MPISGPSKYVRTLNCGGPRLERRSKPTKPRKTVLNETRRCGRHPYKSGNTEFLGGNQNFCLFFQDFCRFPSFCTRKGVHSSPIALETRPACSGADGGHGAAGRENRGAAQGHCERGDGPKKSPAAAWPTAPRSAFAVFPPAWPGNAGRGARGSAQISGRGRRNAREISSSEQKFRGGAAKAMRGGERRARRSLASAVSRARQAAPHLLLVS